MTEKELDAMKYKVCCPMCDNHKCVRGTEECEAELWKKRRMKQMTNKLTKEEALKKVRGYLTDYLPLEDYDEVEDIMAALEHQPCEDCISREEAINVVHKYFVNYLKLNDDICLDGIRSLSSVQLQRPKGKWIDNNCSICGYGVEPWNNTPHCPNCGADMRESEE